MPQLIVYLLKANVALCLFYLAYRLLLRRLTFYYLNRIFLVFGIIFSSVYPFIDLSWLFIKHEVLSRQLIAIVPNWQVITPVIIPQHTKFDYWQIPIILFWMGVIVMAIRFTVQLFSLYNIYKNSNKAEYNGHAFRSVKSNISPFSFWQAIYLNPDKHQDHELQAIIEHEKVHVKQWHTLDVLLAELSTVFYWFNPGVWLMKQAVKENLEFITDHKILQSGIDEKVYQYSLVRVSNLKQSAAIVNNFNFLTIKKRIMMMNKKRSSKAQVSRYIILLPLVVILALAFTVSKAELSPKSISAFVKRVLPRAIVNNDDQYPMLSSVTDQKKPIPTSIDTTHSSEKTDTTNFKHPKQPIKLTADDSTVVDKRNNSIAGYGKATLLSGSVVLRANIIKSNGTGNLDLKKALYVFITGKDQFFSNSYDIESSIDPSKIDSMTVLKSNDAIALYGNRANYGAVIIKLKPATTSDVLQMSETKNGENSDVKATFSGSVIKTVNINGSYLVLVKKDADKLAEDALFGAYSNLSTTNVNKGDKIGKGQVIGTVSINSSTGKPDLNYELYRGMQRIDPNADVDNSQEITCIVNPNGAQKSDFKEVIKLFKDNGFALNFGKEYKGDLLDLLKISLASNDKTAMSATYHVKDLIDTHYYISIKANKVTNQLYIQSVKGN